MEERTIPQKKLCPQHGTGKRQGGRKRKNATNPHIANEIHKNDQGKQERHQLVALSQEADDMPGLRWAQKVRGMASINVGVVDQGKTEVYTPHISRVEASELRLRPSPAL